MGSGLLKLGLQGDFVTALGATAIQGALPAGGCHSGAKTADTASFALCPFQGTFHEGDLLNSERALEYV
jgi:hypothetical protein